MPNANIFHHLGNSVARLVSATYKPLTVRLRWFLGVLYSGKVVRYVVEHEARVWSLEEVRVLERARHSRGSDCAEAGQALSKLCRTGDSARRGEGHHEPTSQKRPTARSLSLLGAGGAIDPAPPGKPLDLDPSRNPPRGGSLLPPEIDPAALVIGDRSLDYGD